MGGSTSKLEAVSKAQQRVVNELSASCTASCTQVIDGLNIEINGKVGDVTILQKCQANASCIMDANINAVADALLDVNTSQKIKNGLADILKKTITSTTKLDMIQEIKAAIEMDCGTSVAQSATDISFLVGTGGDAKSFKLIQEGNADATCPINMSSTGVALSKGYVTANQVSDSSFLGLGSIGTYVMYAIIALVVIFVIIMIIKMTKKKKENVE